MLLLMQVWMLTWQNNSLKAWQGGFAACRGRKASKTGTVLPYSLFFNPQFQSFKLLLGHALQSHCRGQIQGGNVFHFVAVCYLATEFLYFRVSAHLQKHFIRIGDGQSLFNQAMLYQNAMIRRYCRCRWMGLRSALVLFSVFHCTMLTRFLIAVISWRS